MSRDRDPRCLCEHGPSGAHDPGCPTWTEPPSRTPGVQPLTVIQDSVNVTVEEMAWRVIRTREEHGDLLQQYHQVWYNAPHTWHYLSFLGVGMMKCPNDLWMYQQLMAETRPKVVIETGTYQGGSALWFAYLMDMLAIEGGRVFTVDFEDRRRCDHPRITFLGGDSRDPEIRDAIRDELGPGPRMISLDADHSAAHVLKELELYAPLAQVGDYLVVEDTNIAWGEVHRPVVCADGLGRCWCGAVFAIDVTSLDQVKCPNDDGSGDRGARGGIEDYLSKHPGEFVQEVLCERWLLTMHPGGWLRRVAECPHG